MSDWSISKRIGSMTMALLGLVILIGVTGMIAIISISQHLNNIAEAADEAQISGQIIEDALKAEAAKRKFLRTHGEASITQFRDSMTKVKEDKERLSESFADDPGMQEELAALHEASERYAHDFEELVRRQFAVDADIKAIRDGSGLVKESTASVIAALTFDGNTAAIDDLRNLGTEYLESRVATEAFFATNEQVHLDAALAHLDMAETYAAQALAAVDGSGRRASIEEITGLLAAFREGLTTAATDRQERDALIDKMTADLERLSGELGVVSTDLASYRDGAVDRATTTRNAVAVALLVLGLLGLAGGFLFARRVSNSIGTAIGASVDQMSELAKGNLEVEITGGEAQHELGDIARALVVFRDNEAAAREQAARTKAAEEQAQRDKEAREAAEQEAERKRQAAAEAERKAMIASLRDSLGSVVDAAADGDFSRRIETKFAEAELDEMAASINTLVQNVESGVAETARVMSELASGNLTDRMSGAFKGKFAELQSSVNGTIGNLSQLVGEIAAQCQGLGNEVDAMSNQAADLARRAEQQAAALEESSAVMEEMSAAAKSSAEGAQTSSRRASEVSAQVDEAGTIVQNAVAAMGDIHTASQKIGEIVSVIDGIAFQTNLLALNASVEAARAGSAGKGFAVVATEVRALAQRSSEASQDIKTLIEESTVQVNRGVSLVEKTGTTLGEIVTGVSAMSATMGDLATTAHEQATGVAEASNAITQMDMITQKNAALADESRETAAKVRQQADAMARMVASFRITEGGEHAYTVAAE